ncbi:hypothetical protein B566_EDAN003973 [Ephemera danica]|nr:hypothetical protein B566_EDAN003973 [Ephemera danica]
MGTPAPAVSLYVSGKLVHTQNNTRHLVVVLHNVTRQMRQVSCYADNGYGTPMQASRKVVVNFPPSVSTASTLTLAIRGGSVVLECKVEAQPDPQTVFWRDASGRVPVVHGGRFEYSVKSVKGSSTPMNATSCCEQMAVTAGCMDACSTGAFMDLDAVLDQPECVNDLYKMIRCAADGSDHRSCCTQRGLPQSCLNWCRGEIMETGGQVSSSVSTAPNNHKFCLLVYGQQIMACFQQGQDRLPGAPQRVRSILVGSHWADIAWDVPLRNPQAATTYRRVVVVDKTILLLIMVFWRQIGSRTAMKNDSITSPLRIYGLKPSTTYECVVKAGNPFGSSMLSKPFKFSTASDEYITTSASMGTSHIFI